MIFKSNKLFTLLILDSFIPPLISILTPDECAGSFILSDTTLTGAGGMLTVAVGICACFFAIALILDESEMECKLCQYSLFYITKQNQNAIIYNFSLFSCTKRVTGGVSRYV